MFTRRTAMINHMKQHDPKSIQVVDESYFRKKASKRRKVEGSESEEDAEDEDDDEDEFEDEEEDDYGGVKQQAQTSQRKSATPIAGPSTKQKTPPTAAQPILSMSMSSFLNKQSEHAPVLLPPLPKPTVPDPIASRVANISAEIAAAIRLAQAKLVQEEMEEDSDIDGDGSEDPGTPAGVVGADDDLRDWVHDVDDVPMDPRPAQPISAERTGQSSSEALPSTSDPGGSGPPVAHAQADDGETEAEDTPPPRLRATRTRAGKGKASKARKGTPGKSKGKELQKTKETEKRGTPESGLSTSLKRKR